MPQKFPLTHLFYISGHTNQGTGRSPRYIKLKCLTENIISVFWVQRTGEKKGKKKKTEILNHKHMTLLFLPKTFYTFEIQENKRHHWWILTQSSTITQLSLSLPKIFVKWWLESWDCNKNNEIQISKLQLYIGSGSIYWNSEIHKNGKNLSFKKCTYF